MLDLGEEAKVSPLKMAMNVELIKGKDPARLKYIGDKNPGWINHLKCLHIHNSKPSFTCIWRKVEEVAESFEARARNPNDRFPEKNGFELGIWYWNRAMVKVREFIEGPLNPEVLVIGYDNFFGEGSNRCAGLISGFLEVDFDGEVRRTWKAMSEEFMKKRRPKEPLSAERAELVKTMKDTETEEWTLRRIEEEYARYGV